MIIKDFFTNLTYVKQQIAEMFNTRYFDENAEYYWLGETLSINDEFVDLANIKYALENDVCEEVLFKYLRKHRNFDLGDYCLGKLGRKEKRNQELKKSEENVKFAWEQLEIELKANKEQ